MLGKEIILIILIAVIAVILYLRNEFRKQSEKDDDLGYYRKFSSH